MRCRGRRRMRTAARKSDARRALSRKTARAHGGAKERCASRTIAEDDAGARQCEKATRGTRCHGGRRKRTAARKSDTWHAVAEDDADARRRGLTAARKSDARHALSRKTAHAHSSAKERRASRPVAEDGASTWRRERAMRVAHYRGGRRGRTAMRKGDARHALSRRTTQAHGNAKRRRAARAVAEDDADARRCERATRAFAENDAGAACGLKATI